jgi:hypothetical protein
VLRTYGQIAQFLLQGSHLCSCLKNIELCLLWTKINNLLQYRTNKSKTDRVPLVLTYSKSLPHVREIIKKKMTVLHKSEKMKKSVHKTTNCRCTINIIFYVKSFSFKIGECMGVTNIRTNSTVPTARFTFMFLFKKHRIMLSEKPGTPCTKDIC